MQDKVKNNAVGDTCKKAVPWVGARGAWINGSNAVQTPVSDPLVRARVHAYAAGNGRDRRTRLRVGLSASQFGTGIPLKCLVRFGETLKATLKKTPCNNTWWQEKDSPKSSLVSSQGAVSPPLPTVVAGSSMDHRCTGTKGQRLVYNVQQAPYPAISPKQP